MGCIVNYYKKELQRVAWRLQYKARSERKRECQFIEEIQPSHCPLEATDNHILIQQLLNELQSETGRKIIGDLFLRDRTEAQLAEELNLSQQAVNKWKRKILHLLSQKMSS